MVKRERKRKKERKEANCKLSTKKKLVERERKKERKKQTLNSTSTNEKKKIGREKKEIHSVRGRKRGRERKQAVILYILS